MFQEFYKAYTSTKTYRFPVSPIDLAYPRNAIVEIVYENARTFKSPLLPIAIFDGSRRASFCGFGGGCSYWAGDGEGSMEEESKGRELHSSD